MSPVSAIDVPEALTPFVPTFEVLLLDVKHTPPAELTQTGQPLGWLLTVLQKERASVEEITQALETALQHLEALQASHTQQHHQTLTPALEAIDDLNRLKQLNIEASVVDSFHAFEERLQA